MAQNEFLIRARKAAGFSTQRDLGRLLSNRLGADLKDTYSQKKVSLWESNRARPTPEEMDALEHILGLPKSLIEDSFTSTTPTSAADTISSLVESVNPCLLAACFGGRSRDRLVLEVQDSLRRAINANFCIAMFFPYPLDTAVKSLSARGLVGTYIETWRAVVRFREKLINLAETPDACQRVKLYTPRTTLTQPANILLPPMLRRHTLIYEARNNAPVSRAYYVWSEPIEGDMDAFYKAGGRNVEGVDHQIDVWEQYFGDIVGNWLRTHTLCEGDVYWVAV